MKSKIATLIFFCILLQTLAGQNPAEQLRVFPVTELSALSKKLIKLAGGNLPGSTESRENNQGIRLDSTILFDLIPEIDSIPVKKAEHNYPKDKVEEVLEYQYVQDAWEIESKVVMVSDDLGRRTSITAYRFNPLTGEFTPDSRIEIFPYKDHETLLDSFFISRWTLNGVWEVELSTWNIYSKEANLLEATYDLVLQGETITLVEKYYYEKGKLKLVEFFSVIDEEIYPGGISQYHYTNATTIEKIDLLQNDEGFLDPVSKEITTLNAQGLKELVNTYTYDSGKHDWAFENSNGYVYDTENRLVFHEVVLRDAAGFIYRSGRSYEYLQGNKLSIESDLTYNADIENWEAVKRLHYYYTSLTSSDEVPQSTQHLDVFPNPVVSDFTVEVPSTGELVVYSLHGQEIMNVNVEPGQKTISMTSYPAGTYFLLLKTQSGARFTNTLIKQ